MSKSIQIDDSTLPYKEKLIAAGYVKLSQLPPKREDSDWNLLLNTVLRPPELIELKNSLFPEGEGKSYITRPLCFSLDSFRSFYIHWIIFFLFFVNLYSFYS